MSNKELQPTLTGYGAYGRFLNRKSAMGKINHSKLISFGERVIESRQIGIK